MEGRIIGWLLALLLVCSLLPAVPARAMDDSFLGYNEHLQGYGDYQQLIDQIEASGVKWIRLSIGWGGIETSKNSYNSALLAKWDDIVNRLNERGIQILGVLCYTAPWASSAPETAEGRDKYKPANWADWDSYVQFLANRYNGKINYWEVWNEPDHASFWKSSVDDYYTMLQRSYGILKGVNPSNKVLNGGLAMTNGTTASYGLGTWFDTLMGKGAGAYFDIISYHAYGEMQALTNQHKGMMDIVNKYPAALSGKKIWITETGFPSSGSAEYRKANFVDMAYRLNKRLPNVERMFWYVFRNTATGNAREDSFGLVDQSRNPLKAYYHYRALNGAGADWSGIPDSAAVLTLNEEQHDSGVTNEGNNKRVVATRYMYFKVNDQWLYDSNGGLDSEVRIEVTYLDAGTGAWSVHYDAASDAYKSAGSVTRTGTGTWKTKVFTITDGRFANRQNVFTDFRISAGSQDLVVSEVVIRKEPSIARVLLKGTNAYKEMEQVQESNPANEGYTTAVTIGGAEARRISGSGKYFYFQVGDGFAQPTDSALSIGISYYDSGTDKIRLEYNAAANAYKQLLITKTGTNTWKYIRFELTDASFANKENYYSDFRIGSNGDGSDEYIRMVEVLKP